MADADVLAFASTVRTLTLAPNGMRRTAVPGKGQHQIFIAGTAKAASTLRTLPHCGFLCFPVPLPQGSVAALQAGALSATDNTAQLPALLGSRDTAASTRAHVEASIAAAVVLRNGPDYERWLLVHANLLAGMVCTYVWNPQSRGVVG